MRTFMWTTALCGLRPSRRGEPLGQPAGQVREQARRQTLQQPEAAAVPHGERVEASLLDRVERAPRDLRRLHAGTVHQALDGGALGLVGTAGRLEDTGAEEGRAEDRDADPLAPQLRVEGLAQ